MNYGPDNLAFIIFLRSHFQMPVNLNSISFNLNDAISILYQHFSYFFLSYVLQQYLCLVHKLNGFIMSDF